MKSYSIRKKLSLRLSLTITLTLLFTLSASFLYTKNEIQKLFDANLAKTSKLILGLIKHEIEEEQDPYFMIDPEYINGNQKLHQYEYKLHSQAWNNSRLIYNSDEKFTIAEPKNEGFSDIAIDNKKWRIFTFIDDENLIKISVLEKYYLRNDLILEILSSLILPFLICILLMIFIIFKIINKSIKPLGELSCQIEKMSSETLEKFQAHEAPEEMRPFINSFNDLIVRLKNSLESERRFTDYAAHELRTPLAAIKAQSQLLLKNKNKEKQEEFLQDLISGVNRTTDMVEKLLILTRLEPEKDDFVKEEINLSNIAKTVIKEFKESLEDCLKTDFDKSVTIFANKTYIEILLRNLIENAIKYKKDDTKIEIIIIENTIIVKNEGDFVERSEEKLIFGNFFRAKNKKSIIGSGLGLAICKKIADLHNAKISYSKDKKFNVMKVNFTSK